MKYSVLTTTNNNNIKFYQTYLDSINNQKIIPKEIVLINDGSLIRNMKNFIRTKLNKNIILYYIENTCNLGIAKSLNLGLKKCTTDLIFRLDIDDTWYPNHSKNLLSEYSKDKRYLIYSNNIKNFNKKGLYDVNLLIDNPTVHSSWLINRTIKKNFLYNENEYPEDFATLSKYMRDGFKFKLIETKTINYYDLINSQSKKKIANRDLKKIKKKNLKYFLKTNSYLKLIEALGLKGIIKLLLR